VDSADAPNWSRRIVSEAEQTVAESFVYNDTGVPAREVVLQQMIAPEEQQ